MVNLKLMIKSFCRVNGLLNNIYPKEFFYSFFLLLFLLFLLLLRLILLLPSQNERCLKYIINRKLININKDFLMNLPLISSRARSVVTMQNDASRSPGLMMKVVGVITVRVMILVGEVG
jgi:hypothetical protein